jgi:WhiB family redox-sensing transcriptional regulator
MSLINVPELPPGAACADPDSDIDFFPEVVEGQDNHGADAKAACAQCPALVACLEGALDRREEFGIWGGAGEDQRRDLGRAYRKRHAIPEAWTAKLAQHIARLDGADVGVVNRNGPNATHGLRVTYNRGCRCRACRFAMKDDVARITVRKRAGGVAA